MNKIKKILLWVVVFSISYFAFSYSASAWTWGEPLVPCGVKSVSSAAKECTRCELFHLVKNLIDFGLIVVLPVGSTILFVIAGLYYILGGANPSFHSKAKDLFTNTLYGIVVIAMAWIITNTVLVNLSDGGTWGEFVCTNPVPATPGPSVTTSPTVTVVPGTSVAPTACDAQSLAQRYGTRPSAGPSQEVSTLISCIRGRLPGQNLGSVFHVDESNPLCNYTRGNVLAECGMTRCSHTRNSCHYGGVSGNQGAMAIDFGNEVIGDQIIAAARACGASDARCETPGGRAVACIGAGANHVHVNSASCSD